MPRKPHRREGELSWFCAAVVTRCYGLTRSRSLRRRLRSIVFRMERGAIYSLTIRELYRRFHGVEVGLYTIGPCEGEPGNLAPGTRVGRYSSIYYTVRTIACDQPGEGFPGGIVSLSALRDAEAENGHRLNLTIGNDVFIGHNAIVLPSVEQIGDGAVIGAGTVVHQNIAPYAVVTGNPARVVRFRFPPDQIQQLIEEKWWLKTIDELSENVEAFRRPLAGTGTIR